MGFKGLAAGSYYGTAESASLSALCAVREAIVKKARSVLLHGGVAPRGVALRRPLYRGVADRFGTDVRSMLILLVFMTFQRPATGMLSTSNQGLYTPRVASDNSVTYTALYRPTYPLNCVQGVGQH